MTSSIQAVQDQNVPEGHNFTLTRNVSGMPPLMVSWSKPNGQGIAGKVLELVSINRSEAGQYTCEASNECGNATEMASIDVQCKHIIFKHHYHIVVDPVEKSIF